MHEVRPAHALAAHALAAYARRLDLHVSLSGGEQDGRYRYDYTLSRDGMRISSRLEEDEPIEAPDRLLAILLQDAAVAYAAYEVDESGSNLPECDPAHDLYAELDMLLGDELPPLFALAAAVG